MKTLKTFVILFFVLVSTGLAYGQMKIQPKTIVVVLGPKNPTFDEANFPDIHFYYTPDLVLKTSKKASENTNKRAWSSALGVGRTAGAEEYDQYTGAPADLVDKGVHSGNTFLLDKEGLINAVTYTGENLEFQKGSEFLVKFNKLQRKWETETFANLLKTIDKKGSALQKTKKGPENDGKYEISESFDNFSVVDKDGNTHSMPSLLSDNSATLVLFLRINPEYDLNKGKESGKGKKGKDYMNEVAQSVAAEKQIAPLYRIEKGIFGKR